MVSRTILEFSSANIDRYYFEQNNIIISTAIRESKSLSENVIMRQIDIYKYKRITVNRALNETE